MFIPDAGGQGFTYTADVDTVLTGAFCALGRAILSTIPGASVAGTFSFPAEKKTSNDYYLAVTEKLFFPMQHQLNAGQTIFLELESQGVFMLYLDESLTSQLT